MRCLVLLSGGLDSLVTLQMANNRPGVEDLTCLFFDYNQKALGMERYWSQKQAEEYGAKWVSLYIDNRMFSTALVKGDWRDVTGPLDAGIEVPNRNMVFLANAIAYAASQEYDEIWYGIQGFAAGPELSTKDISPAFHYAMQNALYCSVSKLIQLNAPLLHLRKAEVIKWAENEGVPMHMAYSCYSGDVDHCMRCLGCKTRFQL